VLEEAPIPSSGPKQGFVETVLLLKNCEISPVVSGLSYGLNALNETQIRLQMGLKRAPKLFCIGAGLKELNR